ncbi:hypothetical protein AB0L88_37215 [Saccharopolyspora shandongensis]|uniref:hypothetical protein n=1 Tax=Saccharopolyspora TaxID=1835 RepID=UPI0033D327F5
MSRFDINHDGYMDLNEQLRQCHVAAGVIIEELNQGLKKIPEGMQGQAEVLWGPLQAEWNRLYAKMSEAFNDNVTKSFKVHEIFKDGDNMGARIMSM